MKPLLAPVFRGGELVYNLPRIDEIRAYAKAQKETLWPEYKRLHKPHYYKVDLSQPLWDMKHALLHKGDY